VTPPFTRRAFKVGDIQFCPCELMATAPRQFCALLAFALVAGASACSTGELLMPEPPGGGENVALSKFDGDNQEGTVGETLPAPLIVSVRTAGGRPAEEREVEFVTMAGDVEVARDTAITDSEGNATVHCVLGTVPGDYVIRASLIDLEGEAQVQEFIARARPGPPHTLTATSPITQPGRRARPAPISPIVNVVDRFGNAVPETLVAWQVTAGEGEVSEALTRTTQDGSATVDWTLGNRTGVHKLTAAVEQPTVSPVTFTVTVLF
jgi:hypothetical protein